MSLPDCTIRGDSRASQSRHRRGRASSVPASCDQPPLAPALLSPSGPWGPTRMLAFNLGKRGAECRGHCTLLRCARVVTMPRGDPHRPAEEATHECTA